MLGLFSLPKSGKTANRTLGIRDLSRCTKHRHFSSAWFSRTCAGCFCRNAQVPASASISMTSVSRLASCGRWACRNNANGLRWITGALPWVGIPHKQPHPKGVTVTNSTFESFPARCQKVLQVAKQLHSTRPDWVTFFRETLGVDGSARSVFGNQEEYLQFEQSEEFDQIQALVASLRTKKGGGRNESTKVITVRLPESLHESLKAEASEHGTSMNKLCITKLLKALSDLNEESQEPAPAPPAPQRTLQHPAVTQSTSGQSNFRSTYQPPRNS